MKPLRALLVVALFLPPILVAALAWHSYNTTTKNAFAYGERTATVIREHALRVLKAQETAINWIDARLEGMSWNEIRNSAAIHEFLQRIRQQSEHIDGIWLFAPDGRAANSAEFFPMPDVDARDRDYYRVLKERDITYLGEMIEGKLNGTLNFNISRRRSTRDGSFDGLILVTASLDYLASFWQEILGDEDSHVVALLRADGSILARYPGVINIAQRVPANSPFYTHAGVSAQGSYAFRAGVDNRDRLYSYAKLADYPAYIVVGLDREAVLAPWRQNLWVMAGLAVIGMLFLGLVVHRAQRRENRLAAEVDRRRVAETNLIEKSEHLSAMEKAEEALRNSEEKLLAALEAGQIGTFRYDFDTGDFQLYDGTQQLFGLSAEKNHFALPDFLSLIHPDDRAPVEKALADGRETGATVNTEFRVAWPDGRTAWLYARSRTHADPRGCPSYLSGACVDITQRKEAEERQKLISAELDHRVRNTLASIQSILRLSERSTATKQEFTNAVSGRVQAMARAHGHLTQSGWRGVELRALIADELAPYCAKNESKAELEGPDILLLPAAAVSMALVLHELTTNAAKYGALSTPEGCLRIGWKVGRVDEGEMLDFEWAEYNGPVVGKPARRGFGSTMLKRILQHEFGARVKVAFPPEGFRFRATFALERVVAVAGYAGETVDNSAETASVVAKDTRGIRVLVVEDEMVLAFHVAEMLEALGMVVLGPFGRLDEAIAAARSQRVDSALLDINLAGTEVFPLADLLAENGTPFVFVSGYEPGIRPERFRDRPLIRKPATDADILDALQRLLQSSPTLEQARHRVRRRRERLSASY